jgi:hypothetical protein
MKNYSEICEVLRKNKTLPYRVHPDPHFKYGTVTNPDPTGKFLICSILIWVRNIGGSKNQNINPTQPNISNLGPFPVAVSLPSYIFTYGMYPDNKHVLRISFSDLGVKADQNFEH